MNDNRISGILRRFWSVLGYRSNRRQALEKHTSLDEVLDAGILEEENQQKDRMKYCLLLEIAWELAKADGVISHKHLHRIICTVIMK